MLLSPAPAADNYQQLRAASGTTEAQPEKGVGGSSGEAFLLLVAGWLHKFAGKLANWLGNVAADAAAAFHRQMTEAYFPLLCAEFHVLFSACTPHKIG